MPEVDEQYLGHVGKMRRPVPGSSLTNDPSNPMPFEKPPEFVRKKDAIEDIFARLTEGETYPKLIESLGNGIPVMEITQAILYVGFTKGKWNPDLFLLLVEPTAYIIMALAERAGVDYRIDRDPDDEDLEEEELTQVETKLKEIQGKLGKSGFSERNVPVEIRERISNIEAPSLIEKPEGIGVEPEDSDSIVPRRG